MEAGILIDGRTEEIKELLCKIFDAGRDSVLFEYNSPNMATYIDSLFIKENVLTKLIESNKSLEERVKEFEDWSHTQAYHP